MSERVRLGVGELDLRAQRITGESGDVRLTAREVEVVRYLLAREGEAVSREDLARDIWGHGPNVRSRAVDQSLKRLRRKIEVDPSDPRHLLTVHGVGYRFVTERAFEEPGAPVTSFVGRDSELESIEQWMTSDSRLLTLVGPGGVGKTRLAREALRRASGPSKFCDLSTVRDAAEMIMVIRRELGAHVATVHVDTEPYDECARDLRSQGGVLLVLDNAESAIEAVASLVAACLRLATNARFIVTSREPLAIRGERVLRVGALPVHEARELLISRIEESAGVEVQEDMGEEVIEGVLKAVACLPLGVELIAFRCAREGVSALADTLTLTDDGPRDLPERQRTLWNTVLWSWRDLSPGQKELLMRMAVARSAHSLRELERFGLTAQGSIRRLVSELHARSLLERVAGIAGEGRYRMLPPVRQFALEHLQASENTLEVRRAFVEGMLSLAREKTGTMGDGINPRGAKWSLATLESLEHATRLAIEAKDPQGAELALLTERALRGWSSPGPRNARLDEALGLVDIPPRIKIGLLLRRGIGAFFAADYGKAEGLARAVGNLGETVDDDLLFARSQSLLAQTLFMDGRKRAGIETASQALRKMGRPSEHGSSSSILRYCLVWMLYNTGDFNEALEMIEEIRRASGNAELSGHALGYSLGIRRDMGDPMLKDAEWMVYLDEQRAQGGDPMSTMNERVRTFIDQGCLDEARELLDQSLKGGALEEHMPSHHLQDLMDACYLSSLTLAMAGRFGDAARQLRDLKAVAASRSASLKLGIVALSLTAILAIRAGDFKSAKANLREIREREGESLSCRFRPFVRVVNDFLEEAERALASDQVMGRGRTSALTLSDGESPSMDLRAQWKVIVLARQGGGVVSNGMLAEG